MADTYTANTALAMPALNQTGWNVEINANYQLLDALTPVGALAITLTEQPSASLNVKVAPGTFVNQSGAVVTYAGFTSQAVPTGTVRVFYLDGTAAWALTLAAAYPTTAHIRLGTVTAGATTITNVVDNRLCFDVIGSWVDGANLTFGVTTGTQIGTAAGQKIGFYGATPVIQQTGGVATAGASYTATEQGMVNRMYTSLRALGLLN